MHPQQPHFRLSRSAVLLGIISATFPMTGYCIAAGRADFVIGNVEAISVDGTRRALARGAEINTGDSINTAEGARAQVRFIDGGYVSLQPNTLFRVDEFNYKNKTDGEEKGFFSLLKGSLRAITGAIGHINRNTYKVATPSATIGIRGTGYKAEIRDDGLFVSVGEGAISLTNNAGLLLVTAGNAAFVANPNTPPTPSREQPQTPPASLQPIATAGAIIQPVLPSLVSGPGYAMTFAYLYYPTVTAVGSSAMPTAPLDAIFNSNSQLLKYSNGTDSGAVGTASITFSATDGIIGWGRWDGSVDPSGTLSPSPGGPSVFHYVIGIPTAVMPTTGTATYSLMGYTNPSATDASTGWNLSGNLSANFATTNVDVNLFLANAADDFTIAGTIGRIGSTFLGLPTTTGTTVCSSGCNTTIKGFFAGDNASRAGLSYNVIDGNGRAIQGTAAFTQ